MPAGIPTVEILSPTSRNAYDGLGALAKPFVRTAWRALLCADMLQKMLLIQRPHEERRGSTKRVYQEALADLCTPLERAPLEPGVQLLLLRDSLVRGREPLPRGIRPGDARLAADRHRRRDLLPPQYFSNEDLVRSLEAYGAEAWVSDLVEWIWYTNSEHFRKLKLNGPHLDRGSAGRMDAQARAKARRARACWSPSARISPDAKSPISTKFWKRPALPAARRRVRRNGVQRGKGRLLRQERRRRNHRHKPVYLYERNCLRGDLSAD